MRVSKLEPHVLGGPPAEDLDNVLESLDEASIDVGEVDPTEQDPLDSTKEHTENLSDTLVRLADYLKSRNQRNKSLKSVALSRYIWQRDLALNARHKKGLKI